MLVAGMEGSEGNSNPMSNPAQAEPFYPPARKEKQKKQKYKKTNIQLQTRQSVVSRLGYGRRRVKNMGNHHVRAVMLAREDLSNDSTFPFVLCPWKVPSTFSRTHNS